MNAQRNLIEEFPWLCESELQKLAKKPWLQLYLEADDDSVDRAVERHRLAQSEARKELKERGKVALRRVSVRGLQTTMLEDPLHHETEVRR